MSDYKFPIKTKVYSFLYMLMRFIMIPYYIIMTILLLCVIWGEWVKKNVGAIHIWVDAKLIPKNETNLDKEMEDIWNGEIKNEPPSNQ